MYVPKAFKESLASHAEGIFNTLRSSLPCNYTCNLQIGRELHTLQYFTCINKIAWRRNYATSRV